MKPERWQKIFDLAEAAAELANDERAALLAEACAGDVALRKEVESLLESDERSESLIEAPVFRIAAELIADDQDGSMAGQVVGAYKIIDLLGVGGMGEVYLAEDTRLGRKVALKFLPVYFTSDRSRVRRFEQEARAASALNHPNILTVYEVGKSAEAKFIAAEFVEGKTLRQHMESVKMTVGEVLDVAIQAASALGVAHQAGIVHRDIKPENIMLRPDGYIKILDFGLAKITEPRRLQHFDGRIGATITSDTSPVMGTPYYMSPEQARGLKVGGRSDIFSLGAVIYEMLTGRKPFDGETPSHVVVSILEKDPRPLSEVSPGCAPGLEQIVFRALQKDTEARYQAATDLMADLKTLKQEMVSEGDRAHVGEEETRLGSTGPANSRDGSTTERSVSRRLSIEVGKTPRAANLITQIKPYKRSMVLGLGAIIIAAAGVVHFSSSGGDGKTIKSLAVLPFVNASSDPALDYLSDGIADTLTSSLSRLSNLTVISSTAVSRYQARERRAGGPDAEAVGREFMVRAVLAGKVAKRGDRIHISAELIDTSNNTRLWGEQYDRTFEDIVSVQQEIAKRISEKLTSRLAWSPQNSTVGKNNTGSADAYDAYLKGRYFWNKRTDEGLRKAIEFYDQAIGLDPNYALAYAGLADCYQLFGFFSGVSPTVSSPKAKAAAERAIEIDDSLAEAHNALAYVKFYYEWDWSGAETEFKRAIQLDPNYATAHQWYGEYLGDMGRKDESLAERTRALALDPLSPIISSELGIAYEEARQYDRAIEEFRKAAEMFPGFAPAHAFLGTAFELSGRHDEALAEYQKATALDNSTVWLAGLARGYALSGKQTEARKILAELVEGKRYVQRTDIATVYIAMGDREAAFEWLEKAYRERDMALVSLKVYPGFDSLRSDARFSDLLKRMNLSQ